MSVGAKGKPDVDSGSEAASFEGSHQLHLVTGDFWLSAPYRQSIHKDRTNIQLLHVGLDSGIDFSIFENSI